MTNYVQDFVRDCWNTELKGSSTMENYKHNAISLIAKTFSEKKISYNFMSVGDMEEIVIRYLRIGFGCAGRYKRIVLLTDGAYPLSHWNTGSLLTSGTPADLWTTLNQMKPEDDASCLLIDVTPKLFQSDEKSA